jgi:molecular chaperone GrpE
LSKKDKKLKKEKQNKTSLLEEEQEIENQTKETEDLQKESDKSEKLIKELQEQNGEYLSHIQRLQADFDNYKRQTEKQRADLIAYANEGLLLKILEVYEDFERAKENCKTEQEYSEGLDLIYKKLTTILEKEGIKPIPTENEKFDPFKHEAMMAENNPEYENGMIIDELAKGYTLKDKVIKYSMVKVCKK